MESIVGIGFNTTSFKVQGSRQFRGEVETEVITLFFLLALLVFLLALLVFSGFDSINPDGVDVLLGNELLGLVEDLFNVLVINAGKRVTALFTDGSSIRELDVGSDDAVAVSNLGGGLDLVESHGDITLLTLLQGFDGQTVLTRLQEDVVTAALTDSLDNAFTVIKDFNTLGDVRSDVKEIGVVELEGESTLGGGVLDLAGLALIILLLMAGNWDTEGAFLLDDGSADLVELLVLLDLLFTGLGFNILGGARR